VQSSSPLHKNLCPQSLEGHAPSHGCRINPRIWHRLQHTHTLHTHTHMYTHTHSHTHAHIHTHKQHTQHTHTHRHTHIPTTLARTHTHTHTLTHSLTHTLTHTHTRTHAHTHTHISTLIYPQSLESRASIHSSTPEPARVRAPFLLQGHSATGVHAEQSYQMDIKMHRNSHYDMVMHFQPD